MLLTLIKTPLIPILEKTSKTQSRIFEYQARPIRDPSKYYTREHMVPPTNIPRSEYQTPSHRRFPAVFYSDFRPPYRLTPPDPRPLNSPVAAPNGSAPNTT